ncbi:type II toxin-antitoxin system VapC family toxin [Sphingomonas sp. DOAB1063]|uniref:Type II toxin-antitoxin system VapC family toxin n=2 Tax=Sphingomonas albertensis TaxID=2762591 RepID=A0ABR7AK49_9SPHN|nr:type II toxin-antitoxin system VapC family toxin [Sphingomonas albertensis]
MVSAFTAEAHSEHVRAWLSQQTDGLMISHWVVTEFSGALAMKRRLGVIDTVGWNGVVKAWQRFCAGELSVEPVTATDFERAATLMDRGDLKLRSDDALHLAIVMDRGWSLATLDHDLAQAATEMRVEVDTVVD